MVVIACEISFSSDDFVRYPPAPAAIASTTSLRSSDDERRLFGLDPPDRVGALPIQEMDVEITISTSSLADVLHLSDAAHRNIKIVPGRPFR
jgi:hypothetical protein